ALRLPRVDNQARSSRATPGLGTGLQRPAEQGVSLARGDRAKRDDTATDLGARASASSNGRPIRPWQGSLATRPREAAVEDLVGVSPFPPIADYAFLSDCEVTALVATSGNLEWTCLPRMT